MFNRKKKNLKTLVIILIILTTLIFGGLNNLIQTKKVQNLETEIETLESQLSSASTEANIEEAD